MSDSVDVSAVLNSEEAPQVEETSEVVVEEVSAPASEEVSEPEPVAAPEPEVEPTSLPTTQEVVQNVQEILTTEPAVSSDSASLEERVTVLEERLDKMISVFKSVEDMVNVDSNGSIRKIVNNICYL